MKKFIQKVLIVSLAVFILSLMIKDVIHVGDTTITQESSKNYNGYYTLRDEQKFIDNGMIYGQLDGHEGYIIQSLETGYIVIQFDIPYIVYSQNEYGNVLALSIVLDYDTSYIYIRLNNGDDLTIDYIDTICIVGISNYEYIEGFLL